MALRLIVSAATALLLIVYGLFWMFVWLVGTNGYSSSKGGAILAGNLVLVIFTIVVASVASAWLANKLEAKLKWPAWAVAPVAIIGACVAAIAFLFAGSLLIILVFGRTP